MVKKRIEWIDFAKILVMLLVMTEHLGLANRDIRDFIVSFHMPVFFFISGIFNSNRLPWSEFIKKNLYRLILPVILWHIIAMLTWEPFIFYITNRQQWFDAYVSSQIGFISGYSCGFGWFMICLLWLKILDRILSEIKYGKYIGFVILPMACYFISSYAKIPFYLLNAFMAYPFFVLGMLSKEKMLKIDTDITPPPFFIRILNRDIRSTGAISVF